MFSSAANQQIQFDLMNATTSSIRYKLTGPDGWIGFGDLSGDSAPISLPASGTYMIEATGTAEQSGSYAFRLLNTTPTALPLDTTYQGTIFSSGQPQIFRIDLPARKHLLIKLDDLNDHGSNELYVKYRFPPTRSDFDSRYSANLAADQTVEIADAAAGTYYVLAYANTAPDSPSDFTLRAVLLDFQVLDVSPVQVGNAWAGDAHGPRGGVARPMPRWCLLTQPVFATCPRPVRRMHNGLLHPTFNLAVRSLRQLRRSCRIKTQNWGRRWLMRANGRHS